MRAGALIVILGLILGWAAPRAAGAVPAPDDSLLNLDWRVFIAAKPIYCILVEKDRQRLLVLRHDGRIQVEAEYRVGTGAHTGPKREEGDSRTPEGVYFITKGYLDHKLSVFGTRAYHLNYPNYFDLRRGRTGFGIFLHGTNRPLQPASSNGCVTLDNGDLDKLADFLHRGTAVFIVPGLGAQPQDPGPLPDLTSHDFAGARALLLPPDDRQADFASLYLIRINNQTVAVGEYWDRDQKMRRAAAYLQPGADDKWTVGDNDPLGEGREAAGPQVAVVGVNLDAYRTGGDNGEQVAGEASSEDRYLDLYLKAVRPGLAAASLPASAGAPPEAGKVAVAPAAAGRGPGSGLTYGLFLLATGVSLGVAVALARRRQQEEGRGRDEAGASDLSQAGEDLRRTRAELATVRAWMDEEERAMERREALQEGRMERLESLLVARMSEFDRLREEQAGWRREGREVGAAQEQALTGVSRELAGLRADLLTAHEELGQREAALRERDLELREVLAAQGRGWQSELRGVFDTLRGQVEALTAAWEAEREELRLARESEARELTELRLSRERAQDEAARLVAESGRWRAEAEQGAEEAARLTQELGLAREELAGERGAAAELRAGAERLAGLERELAEREGRLLALEQAAREGEAELLAGRGERERLTAAWEAEREELRLARESEGRELTELRLSRERAQDEAARLVAESGRWRTEAEQGAEEAARLTKELGLAREELAGERGAAAELRAGAERLAGLERELAEREVRLLALEQAAREGEAELLAGRGERERLTAAWEAEREELRLARESEGRELTELRRSRERAQAEAARLTQELGLARQELAELALARQVEVADLGNAVRQAREDKAASQEAIARLQREVESLTSDLGQTREQEGSETRRRLDQEETLAGLRRENVQLQAKVSELKRSNLDQGVVLIKGAHTLPGEVLRKWIGKG
ncbi:MAG: L,D-transpeptidase family protein [Desulfobacteraceae bacterium]|nr:L,D-transpeptidase family protein [Desulfobacteraceae bacterium]